jgi:hypothetical protein
LKPSVTQLKELNAQFGLGENVKASNDANHFKTLIELKIGLELLE